MQLSLIKLMSFSTAEQYPKLVNGPPPERRRVGKDKKQICDKRERARGRESSQKKGITNNGLRKSHLLFCLQQRCLLASIDQKTKTRGLTIV